MESADLGGADGAVQPGELDVGLHQEVAVDGSASYQRIDRLAGRSSITSPAPVSLRDRSHGA